MYSEERRLHIPYPTFFCYMLCTSPSVHESPLHREVPPGQTCNFFFKPPNPKFDPVEDLYFLRTVSTFRLKFGSHSHRKRKGISSFHRDLFLAYPTLTSEWGSPSSRGSTPPNRQRRDGWGRQDERNTTGPSGRSITGTPWPKFVSSHGPVSARRSWVEGGRAVFVTRKTLRVACSLTVITVVKVCSVQFRNKEFYVRVYTVHTMSQLLKNVQNL